MYKIGNIVYSNPGYYLKGKNKIGYQFTGDESDFTEETVKIDDVVRVGSVIKFNNGLMRLHLNSDVTYGELKSRFIKARYDYDDQIAVILNKDKSDEDMLKFTRMQEWRDWCATLAHAIINSINDE